MKPQNLWGYGAQLVYWRADRPKLKDALNLLVSIPGRTPLDPRIVERYDIRDPVAQLAEQLTFNQ